MGNLERTQWLIAKGLADIDVKTRGGNTALMEAAKRGFVKVALVLLQA